MKKVHKYNDEWALCGLWQDLTFGVRIVKDWRRVTCKNCLAKKWKRGGSKE